MNISNADRAQILVKALPHIQKYNGKTIVIKYGGNAMVSEELQNAVIEDICLMRQVGMNVVLVHGGGPDISKTLKRLGKETEFKNGLRVTDRETVEVAQMILAGKVGKNLVNLINSKGGRAIGLCGIDGKMIEARMKQPELGLGYVGDIVAIRTQPVTDLLNCGYIPVVSGLGYDDECNVYNINADTVAAELAGKLEAECLISVTDECGVLMDKDDPSTLISHLSMRTAKRLIEEGVIAGGMIPKTECCLEALRAGVKKVFIIDGRVPHSILMELLTDEGLGTMFTKN
ncbi:MAG: acetylglutamate kinase [Clostridia bacterium]|nr:acetylglutamate kinase [Clostridia bacterium]